MVLKGDPAPSWLESNYADEGRRSVVLFAPSRPRIALKKPATTPGLLFFES